MVDSKVISIGSTRLPPDVVIEVDGVSSGAAAVQS
jgi:hypothetical protein